MTAVHNFIWNVLSPLRLTGPIFDKELRVSSRRRRNYVLRFAYITLLTAFLALVWVEAMGQSGSAVYRISRMAEAGKFIVMYISSLCITMTTVIFVGSLSLFFSIFSRRTYVVIIVTVIALAAIFGLLPLGLYAVWDITNSAIPEKSILTAIFLPNPYCSMFINTIVMVDPRSAAAITFYSWPLHSGIMLAASAILLFVSVIIVRKVALRQATGQLDGSAGKRRSGRAAKAGESDRQVFSGTIRRVVGPPIIWKELRSPMFRRHKIRTCILVSAGLILLLASYYLFARILNEEEIHAAYAIIFLGVGMLFTIVLPATSITTEIESRSWPVLLVTPLDDEIQQTARPMEVYDRPVNKFVAGFLGTPAMNFFYGSLKLKNDMAYFAIVTIPSSCRSV